MATQSQINRARTALAEETGRIQLTLHQKIKSYSGFILKATPERDYSTREGENPRSIRYRKSRMVHEDYQEFLDVGNENRKYESPGCDGNPEELEALSDKNGINTETAGTTVFLGYDEFTRCPKRTAVESDIINLVSIIEKKAPGEYIKSLRNALVESALERYERSVIKDVINLAHYKLSVNSSFRPNLGTTFFNSIPQGVLSIGMLKRLSNRLYGEGYNENAQTPMVNAKHAIRVYAGEDQIEQAIENYKKIKGYVHMSSDRLENDPLIGETQIFQRYQFIAWDCPTRGTLHQVATGVYEFREVYPTENRVGTGEGIVEVVNDAYYDCYQYCNGRKERLYEIVLITHPDAFERQRFEVPILDKMFAKDGAKYSSFDVEFHNGEVLWGKDENGESVTVKNENRHMAKMKINHAYAPFSYQPEKMAAILVQASPDQIEVFPSYCDSEDDSSFAEVSVGMTKDPGVKEPNQTENQEGEVAYDHLDRSCDDPDPADGAGVIQMDVGPITIYKNQDGTWARNLTICARRKSGQSGAATVDIDSADGTAVATTNYTAVSETLSWADGEGGVKCVTVPILEDAGNTGKVFTVALSNVTGATLPASDAVGYKTTTVTFN